jgi:hypothetical protein
LIDGNGHATDRPLESPAGDVGGSSSLFKENQ